MSEQVWGKRIATSQVAVRNGQTIVIGGMIQDQKTDTINKIPFLGDIPLIGRLFQHTVTGKTKTEVLIFLTPMVAMSPQELKALSKVEEQSAGHELRRGRGAGHFPVASQRHERAGAAGSGYADAAAASAADADVGDSAADGSPDARAANGYTPGVRSADAVAANGFFSDAAAGSIASDAAVGDSAAADAAGRVTAQPFGPRAAAMTQQGRRQTLPALLISGKL